MRTRIRAGLVLVVLSVTFAFASLALAQAAKAGKAAAATGPVLVIETAKGNIEIQTFPQEAPKTVDRVVELVKKNFYNRLRFHRVEKSLLVQVGDPNSKDLERHDMWGRAGSGTPIGVAEISRAHTHVKGAVAMAHPGDPTKADSQFYIMLAPRKTLDGKYTVFGQVISGLDVASKIEVGDSIRRMTVR